jgi:hypothetical protein
LEKIQEISKISEKKSFEEAKKQQSNISIDTHKNESKIVENKAA